MGLVKKIERLSKMRLNTKITFWNKGDVLKNIDDMFLCFCGLILIGIGLNILLNDIWYLIMINILICMIVFIIHYSYIKYTKGNVNNKKKQVKEWIVKCLYT